MGRKSATIGSMNNQLIVDTLRQAYPGLLAVYGFGSRFSGQATDTSDIDLAILVDGRVPPEGLWQQANRLAETLDCDVDLLDLRAASTVMQYQVITTGQRLWQADAQAAIYESFILSEKMELDRTRAGLIEDIQQRGSVYGR